MKLWICFSVSLICFTSCAVAARGTNRTSARTAKNNRPRNLRRVDSAYPFRMNDMAWFSISISFATPKFGLRHDGNVCLRQYYASIAPRGPTLAAAFFLRHEFVDLDCALALDRHRFKLIGLDLDILPFADLVAFDDIGRPVSASTLRYLIRLPIFLLI